MNISYEVKNEYNEIANSCYASCCVSSNTGSNSSYD